MEINHAKFEKELKQLRDNYRQKEIDSPDIKDYCQGAEYAFAKALELYCELLKPIKNNETDR